MNLVIYMYSTRFTRIKKYSAVLCKVFKTQRIGEKVRVFSTVQNMNLIIDWYEQKEAKQVITLPTLSMNRHDNFSKHKCITNA